MKKLLAIGLALAMLLTLISVLASCGSTSTPDGPKETKPETEKEADSVKETEADPGQATETDKPQESQTEKPTKTKAEKIPTFDIVKLGNATITIDGTIEGAFKQGAPLICGVGTCKQWTADNTEEAGKGGGFLGDATVAENLTDEDFCDAFYFAYDNDYLYIAEERIDSTPNYTANDPRKPYTGDGSLIWFINNGEMVGGIQWNAAVLGSNAGDNRSETPVLGWFTEDSKQATSEIKNWEAKVVTNGSKRTMEAKIPLADMGVAAKDVGSGKFAFTFCTVDIVNSYEGDLPNMWSGVGYQLQYPGVGQWARSYRGRSVDFVPSFDIVKLSIGSAIDLDGDVDEVYEAGQPLFCGVEQCKYWTANNTPEKAVNGGIVGDASLAETYTNDDFAEYFYFAYDDNNLYICEYRVDGTPNYTANHYNQPYAGDGSLIWFVNNGKLVGGIQWNAAVMGDNAGEFYSETAVFGWFNNDDQPHAVVKDWESVRQQFPDHYCLEVKIPLTDIGITAADIDAGKIGFTFCTVDIVNHYDGVTSNLWNGIGYQLQYPGVNSWANAYRGNVVTEPEKDYLPDATAALKDAFLSKAKYNTGNAAAPESVLSTPVNLSQATGVKVTVKFDSEFDLTTLTGNGQFELSSGGKCDQSETHWDFINTLKGATLDENLTTVLDFAFSAGRADGNTNGEAANFAAINYIRAYYVSQDAGAEKVNFAITDIEFYK